MAVTYLFASQLTHYYWESFKVPSCVAALQDFAVSGTITGRRGNLGGKAAPALRAAAHSARAFASGMPRTPPLRREAALLLSEGAVQ